MDIGEDSAKAKEKIREGDGKEFKKSKRTITIKVPKSKEEAMVPGNWKRKTPNDNKDK